MLDGWARRGLDPWLDRGGTWLVGRGVSADAVTFAAFGIGLAAATFAAFGMFWAALGAMLVSRLGDGLDGAVAKATRPSDRGGFLDITLDFAFYGAFPFGFVVWDPAANALAGAALLLAFYVNGASFLAFAVMAERRGLSTAARGPKSLFFTTGLAEATETIAAFALMCVLPEWFSVIAWAFAGVTAYTTLSRVVLAWRVLR